MNSLRTSSWSFTSPLSAFDQFSSLQTSLWKLRALNIQSSMKKTMYEVVISKLLKRYSKAKRTRAPAYSRALRRIKGVTKGDKARQAGNNALLLTLQL